MARGLRLPGPVLWTAVISGLSVLYFAFVMPIGRGTDEAEHAFRIYQIATGHLFPELIRCATHPALLACHVAIPTPHVPSRRTGGPVAAGLYEVYEQLLALVQRPGEGSHFNPAYYVRGLSDTLGGRATVFAHFENTALYSPANYLPQTLVMWIGRQTSASVVGTVIAARLLTGMVWAGCVTAAVALAPRWRWLFSLVVLVPTALSQGAMLATDSATLAISALAIASALRVRDGGGVLSRRAVALLCVLCLLLGLLKVPMAVLVLAVAALAWPVLGEARARLVRLAIIVVPGLAAGAWWTLAANRYFVSYRNATFVPAEQANINQAAQEHHLLTHLYDIPALLWNSAVNGHLLHLGGMVSTIGQDGGAGPLPESVAICWLALVALLAAATHEGAPPTLRLRGALALTWLLFFLIAAFGIYVTWDSVGAGTIDGIHGRYTTPALILAVPMLAGLGRGRMRLPPRTVALAVMAVSLGLMVTVFLREAHYYYGQEPWQALPRALSAIL